MNLLSDCFSGPSVVSVIIAVFFLLLMYKVAWIDEPKNKNFLLTYTLRAFQSIQNPLM